MSVILTNLNTVYACKRYLFLSYLAFLARKEFTTILLFLSSFYCKISLHERFNLLFVLGNL